MPDLSLGGVDDVDKLWKKEYQYLIRFTKLRRIRLLRKGHITYVEFSALVRNAHGCKSKQPNTDMAGTRPEMLQPQLRAKCEISLQWYELVSLRFRPNNAAKVSLTFKSPGDSKEAYDTSLIKSWRTHVQSYIFHVKSPKRSDKNLLEASFYIEQFRKLAWLAIWGNGMAQVVELRRMCPRVEGPILQNQSYCKLEQMDKLKIAALFWSHRSPYLKNHKTKSRIRSYEEIISVNLHYAEN